VLPGTIPPLRASLVSVLALLATGAVVALAAAAPASPDWTTYGNGPARDAGGVAVDRATMKLRWVLQLPGAMTAQPLVVHDEPAAGETSVYVASSNGTVEAVAPDGFVRWQVELGQLANGCPQLDGWGVTGTPVADKASGNLYLVDAFGRLHALALATGEERPGWPIRLYTDFEKELVWGALSLVDGALYIPTGSYCDSPMEGHVFKVSVADRSVQTWTSVPYDLGGGGGIWGWGGMGYSTKTGFLFAAVGNAFEGGSNTGDAFTERAGYGEQVVQLDRALNVQASALPTPFAGSPDDDLVGSPVVFDRPGCGELVTGTAKSAELYLWRTNALGAAPVAALRLAKADDTNPMVSQLAWDAKTNTVVATVSGRIVGVRVAADCSARIAFSHQFGPHRLVGSPSVAAGVAWLTHAPHAADYLVAVDLATGRVSKTLRLGGHALVAPTLVDGNLFLAGFNGLLYGFGPPQKMAIPERPPAAADPIPRHTSWFGVRYAWRSVTGGVLATEDKGQTWHPVFSLPADRVLRASRLNGVITVGGAPPKCACQGRVLWTADAGVHWRQTSAIAGTYAGGRDGLFWWRNANVFQVTPWPARIGPLKATRVFHSETGRIAAGAYADKDFYGVLGQHVGGKGWDLAPLFIHVDKGEATTVKLPETTGLVLVRAITVVGKTVDVIAHDYGFAGADAPTVDWHSADGGLTWDVARSP
jgi:hypothetical protein